MDLLLKTIILIEDRRFYRHCGVDLIAIIRALIVNIKNGNRMQGGSTITQQLARTLYLNNKKTYTRKLVEIFLAFYLESRYSKEEILKLYIENVYMGNNIKGMENASMYYFKKPIKEISIGKKAALVAMLKGPNKYKPKTEAGFNRAHMILYKMSVQKLITINDISNSMLDIL